MCSLRFHLPSKTNTRKQQFNERSFSKRATSWVRQSITTMKTRSGSKYCIVEVCCSVLVHFLL
ncbi:hypothetical protein ANCCAN_24750 [Ancylostoma caninum]|uniref:Uncharacterized protein n=1 Tax=Ancylostoma caninum TaxID=29170 RepID=A0A368FBE6_ANCCA|nr:hypothetical protein ANCCAN_24750 [Ancylostoma caninum]